MPSTRITHNPGTHVDHNEAGRQKCELHHSVKSALTREGESAICGQCGVEGWHYLFLGRAGQGRKALRRKHIKWSSLKDENTFYRIR